jgi:site-specific recombinase XerD
VPIPLGLTSALHEYVDNVRPKLPSSPYFFANPRGSRRLRGRYGPRALHDLVLEAGASAGVPGRHFPHRWRHTYATSLVRRGEDIHVVQRLMGHSNIATTTRYLHLVDANLLEPSTGPSRRDESGYSSVVRISGYISSHASSAFR